MVFELNDRKETAVKIQQITLYKAQLADMHRPSVVNSGHIKLTDAERSLLDKEAAKYAQNNVTTFRAAESAALSKPFGYVPYVKIDMSGEGNEREYRYGELNNKPDIDAFLEQLDRFPPEQRDFMKQYEPSKRLLSILEKMDDETLSQFTQVLKESFPRFSLMNNKKADALFKALEGMSPDSLKDTIETFAILAEQAENVQKPVSLIPTNEEGKEPILMHMPRAENGFDVAFIRGNQSKQLVDAYTDVLLRSSYSDDDFNTINAHLKEGDFAKSRGIIDMAKLVSHNDKMAFFDMLNEADDSGPNNIFNYIGQQVNYDAHLNYYKSSEGQFVSLDDAMPDDRQRKSFHKKLLNAYEGFGLNWMNDMIEQVNDKPAQIQAELWSKLMTDVVEKPHLFKKSDSLEQWASANIADVEQRFHARQIDDIHTYSYEQDEPKILGTLTWAERYEH